jgi:2,5-diketo-D-gluconate reductase A
MALRPAPSVGLADGHTIPALGLGTYGMDGDEGAAQVAGAIESGYRLLDTALNYGKLPGRHHGYEEALASFEESRAALGVDVVDLYLIHWPLPRVDKYVDAFRAFVKLQEDGLVRSVGVSNFTEAHLQRLADETGVVPVVNQVELHPYFPQAELRAVHERMGIVTESWSPLAKQSELLTETVVTDIARAHGKTPTQVVLRWHVQLGAVPVPKSADPGRQRENLDVFDFELTEAEVVAISGLERGRLWDGDPETHEEF